MLSDSLPFSSMLSLLAQNKPWEGVGIRRYLILSRGESWNNCDSLWGWLLRLYSTVGSYYLDIVERYCCQSFSRASTVWSTEYFCLWASIDASCVSPNFMLLIQYVFIIFFKTTSPSLWRGCINTSLCYTHH